MTSPLATIAFPLPEAVTVRLSPAEIIFLFKTIDLGLLELLKRSK